MEELKDWLNRCDNNKFFSFWDGDSYWSHLFQANGTNDIEQDKKICEQLNELLLKVKRGEIGMGEAEGCECLMCGKQCKNEGVYCSDCYDKDR